MTAVGCLMGQQYGFAGYGSQWFVLVLLWLSEVKWCFMVGVLLGSLRRWEGV